MLRDLTFDRLVAGVLALGALLAVVYGAVVQGNEQATGAVVAVLAGAVGYYLRGKVAPPSDDQPTRK